MTMNDAKQMTTIDFFQRAAAEICDWSLRLNTPFNRLTNLIFSFRLVGTGGNLFRFIFTFGDD
jgi:hypothetical protein